MLMDLETLDWDDELLSFFDIPRAMLPEIRPSSAPDGYDMTQGSGPFGGDVARPGRGIRRRAGSRVLEEHRRAAGELARGPALADDGPDGDAARARLRDERLVAPELIDLETASVIRRRLQAGQLDARRAALALTDLVELPLRRAPHRLLLARCWELRESLTVYDAAYIALAELLDVVLLTADARLTGAPGLHCQLELLA